MIIIKKGLKLILFLFITINAQESKSKLFFNKNKKLIIFSAAGLSLFIAGYLKKDFIKKKIKILFSSQAQDAMDQQKNNPEVKIKNVEIVLFNPE